MGYCSPSDLYNYGLPRGSVPNPGRLVISALAATSAITLRDHGFAQNDLVSFRAEAGGVLPTPLVQNVEYFAVPLTDDTFSVSATAGGAAVTLTADGSRVLAITPLPIAACIAFGAAIIEDALPSHVVPLVAPYPPIIVMTNAELAIGKLLQGKGGEAVSLSDMVDAAIKRITRWGAGIPLRGTNTAAQTPANVAQSASVPYNDSRGWGQFGGTTRPPNWGGGGWGCR